MLSINIDKEDIFIKDIKRRDLPFIIKWYNQTSEYQYATGFDTCITLQMLIQKYLEVMYSPNEFFVGIYLKDHSELIGLIKGGLKGEGANVVWIYSFIIDSRYRRCGYGTKSFSMLMEHLKTHYAIEWFYISVILANASGIRFWSKVGFEFVKKINSHILLEQKKQDFILMRRELKTPIVTNE